MVIVSKLVQTAMAMVSLTKIRTMNVNARRAVALVLYLMTTTLKKEHLEETTKGLQRAASFLRSQLSRRMSMYTTPELRFVYDESVERGDHLSRLIDQANKNK